MSGADEGPSNVLKEVLPKVHICLRGDKAVHLGGNILSAVACLRVCVSACLPVCLSVCMPAHL